MENEREQKIKVLEEQIKSLPEAVQKVICWIIANIEIVDQLADGEKMSDMEVKRLIQMAKERNDYLLWALVLYKQGKNNLETEKQQEN